MDAVSRTVVEEDDPLPATTPAEESSSRKAGRLKRYVRGVHARLSRLHSRTPYLRRLPLAAILIIALLVVVQLLVWLVCGLILTSHNQLLGTAALAYTLGLRHALDADHISAIDLMTRRLIATGQRPVTVGTFFSLGHSTIVVVTSIVVAATAAGVSKHFGSFGTVGGIIGSTVSAVFLLLLGLMNAYILYRLIIQIRKIIRMTRPGQEAEEAWKIEGGGCLFHVLKRMFKLIDRPWKMYPLGVLFGLGFDTSSEVALLGISSIQGAKGTSMWLILLFPALFTAGMCLVDTIDGALMMSLYVAPMGMAGDKKEQDERQEEEGGNTVVEIPVSRSEPLVDDIERQSEGPPANQPSARVKDPLTFLYYSIVLTTLTVVCAIVIGTIQLLTMVLNVAHPTGPFWDGVETAGDSYEIIGGGICASFVVVGGVSVLCYKPWRRWVDRERKRWREEDGFGEFAVVGHPSHSHPGEEDDNGGRNSAHGTVEELVEVDGKTTTQTTANKAFDTGASGSRA
jgi:high-affinity nickel-transport protein